ncbi:SEC-C metal-binding domain-containing protein [Sedimentibacter sp. MB31-C6]|uniref:SEC-C metal-binding domain-containing protein n=1 Tax=Sedimentibacter sp. MB31-C6 TaxID=3109366 RepID=UPI002DDD9317|nr:SEC-C metal-binding domain-containing protein [Sedimentibacter sp. MB36-C1]WSI05330.1 SEC-C metal-binding domain-containing protein [Sedimentibacter sp. MB36-C1]
MSLYKEWNEILEGISTQEDYQKFWKEYMGKEAECYRKILEEKNPVIEGNIKNLAENNNMTSMQFVGFLDGANTSFKESINLEDLTEESEIKLELDFEKLLWNMHDAKAEWLYDMNEWNNIFDDDKRKQIKKDYNRSKIVVKGEKIGRNDPCPCGSGKKYKKCCGK